MNTILWGCIADDFINAAEAASFFEDGGLKTVLYYEIPSEKEVFNDNIQAIVISLNIKNLTKEEAVNKALCAFEYLNDLNVKQYYYKCCIAFGSEFNLNMGPITDAIADSLGETKVVLCPASLLRNDIVERGRLYIDGVLCGVNKPYNSIRNSEISEFVRLQSDRACINVDLEEMQEDDEEVWNRLNAFENQEGKYYIIPDYVETEDAERIVELFGRVRFFVGSSDIIGKLANQSECLTDLVDNNYTTSTGRAVIVSGSCSDSTISQCEKYIADNGAGYKIDVIRLLYEKVSIGDLWSFVSENINKAVLVYSSESYENVKYNQRHGIKEISEELENTMAEFVELLICNGFTRIIVTGDITCEAVINRLCFNSFYVGKSITSGISVMTPIDNTSLRFVFKAGEYGEDNLFENAIDITNEKNIT